MSQQEQPKKKPGRADHLKPWQFQPGKSGNPAGRPPGPSLKEYAKKYLAGLTEEERMEFMRGLDKKVIWEMAEGKPKAETDITSDGQPIVVHVPQAVADTFNIHAEPDSETGGVPTEQE